MSGMAALPMAAVGVRRRQRLRASLPHGDAPVEREVRVPMKEKDGRMRPV